MQGFMLTHDVLLSIWHPSFSWKMGLRALAASRMMRVQPEGYSPMNVQPLEESCFHFPLTVCHPSTAAISSCFAD